MLFKEDCRHFRGDIPCRPHKKHGYHCQNCPEYSPARENILIIKLGAIGDVIRTTPLIKRIKQEFPKCMLWWITNSPEVIPSSVDKVLPFNLESIISLRSVHFFKIINLDKDHHACALASQLEADYIDGFTMVEGKPMPANQRAMHKYLTGLFDDVNKANTKNYLQEIFEICGYKFSGEEYELELKVQKIWDIPNRSKAVIGLNTGCGARWVSRLWREDYWIELIKLLQKEGFTPMLLGGEQEHKQNTYFAEQTGALYFGYYDLNTFISLVNECDLVVTAVTMGLHIAIGLRKKVVLMNNIFNKNEFELYGRGIIVEPDIECKCFFSPKCTNEEYFCLDHLPPNKIFSAVLQLIEK
jgi:heptosyltransferase-2